MNEREIFIGALQKENPAARQAYLAEACQHDPAVRQRVEALLLVAEQAGSFLESPVVGLPSPLEGEDKGEGGIPTVDEPVTERLGTVIGPYKLLEPIGEGGFGVVFMAEQQAPIRRKVALTRRN
jgi:hypothetical protein